MKLSALLLPLLALTLLQEARSTHLETCECHQIRELVNTTVQEAVADLENRLSRFINSAVSSINTTLETTLTTTMERLLKPIRRQLDYHLPPPPPSNSKDNPATSCKDLHKEYSHAPSSYYWISKSGSPVRVYCSMNVTCGSETGGWMRVANIDMRNTSQSCPSGLGLISSPKRVCDVTSAPQCVSKTFSAQGVQYSHVCGKIIGYQRATPVAFYYGSRGIDGVYVHGVSLTHSENPRKHIWTFAGAQDETTSNPTYKCPCINTAFSSSSHVPSFVGNDYFCDTAYSTTSSNYSPYPLYTADPLWDGKGCGSTNTCCSFNSPPWFVKDLPSPTTDSIEMRVCRPDGNRSPAIETVELYVQ